MRPPTLAQALAALVLVVGPVLVVGIVLAREGRGQADAGDAALGRGELGRAVAAYTRALQLPVPATEHGGRAREGLRAVAAAIGPAAGDDARALAARALAAANAAPGEPARGETAPADGMALLTLLGLAGWSTGVLLFLRRALGPDLRLRRCPALWSGGLFLAGLGLFAVALRLAGPAGGGPG